MSTAAFASPRPVVLADVLGGTRTRNIALVFAGALLVALFAQITVPVPGSPVPVTGQTLAVVIVGASLGATRGVSSLALYTVLGFVLPVYSDGGSGLDHLFGTNGGYIVGFIVAAWLIGKAAEHGADRKPVVAFLAFCGAQLAVFGIGVPWLKVAADMSWGDAIHFGFTVFILGGLLKAAIGAGVTPAAWRGVRKLEERSAS
ncbi:MAG TPA: biotin transporter BioY [Solirubrobacteraceae bacterium]|nr:biotin transporter BioY [Solirubrobacteraceae bacterium]